jgi:cobalt-zinc-cadmium efflux system protein
MSKRGNRDHRVHAEGGRGGGRRSLRRALAITGTWFLIELAGALYSNSLALLADAAHMLTDLAALGLALFALGVSLRPATPQKTYGYLRAEILAALANGIFLALMALYIFYEAYGRLVTPPEVRTVPMIVVAATGLGANLVTAAILFRSRHESLNLRGAFLHVIGDTLGSLGAVVAGVLMLACGWTRADAAVSVLVGALVLAGAWRLVSESVDVLLEGVPRHLDVVLIDEDLRAIPGVASVHDLHVWSIASGTTAMSCHIVVGPEADGGGALAEASRVMREKYGIEHTTIQVEPAGCPNGACGG